MKTFLIQTVNGRIIFDFAFQLLEAIDYQNWYHNKKCFHYILSDSDDMPNCIPVGSVEFVLNYLKKHYGVEGVKPINIPPELMRPVFFKKGSKNRQESCRHGLSIF